MWDERIRQQRITSYRKLKAGSGPEVALARAMAVTLAQLATPTLATPGTPGTLGMLGLLELRGSSARADVVPDGAQAGFE